MSHSILRRAATAAVALATAAVAQAGTLTTNGWLFGAGEAVKVAAPAYSGPAGGFSGTLSGMADERFNVGPLPMYCVDLGQTIDIRAGNAFSLGMAGDEAVSTFMLTPIEEVFDYTINHVTELDTLAAEVNEHRTAVENHPNTAEQAIATGTGQAQWNLVDGLISRYNEIRNEHRRYVKLQSDGNEPRGFVFVAQSAKFLEVDPYWLHRRAATNGRNSTDPAIAAWFASIGGAQTEYARNGIWPTMPRNRWLLTELPPRP